MQDYPIFEILQALVIIIGAALIGGWIVYLYHRTRFRKRHLETEAKLHKKSQEHDALFQRFKSTESLHNDLQIRHRDMDGQYQRLLTNYKRAEGELDEQAEKLKVNKAQRTALVQQLQVLSSYKERYEDLVPRFESQQIYTTDIKHQIAEKEDHNQKLISIIKELAPYRDQFEELIPKYQQIQQDSMGLSENIDNLKKEYDQVLTQKEQAQKNLHEIQLQYESDRRLMGEQKQRIEELTQEKKQIQASLEKLTADYEQAKETVSGHSEQLNKIISSRDELLHANNALTLARDKHESSLSALEHKFVELSKKYEEVQKEASSKPEDDQHPEAQSLQKKQLQMLAQRLGSGLVELDETTKERDRLEVANKQLNGEIDHFKEEYEFLLHENKSLKDSLSHYQLLQNQIRLLQKDIEQTRLYNEELHSMLANEQQMIKSKEAALFEAQDKLVHLQAQLSNGGGMTFPIPSGANMNQVKEQYAYPSWTGSTMEISELSSNQEIILSRIKERANEINFNRIGKASVEEKDDLQKIKGIGAFIEKKLNRIGIYTFKQIANFTEVDEEKINDLIEFFPGRIRRDEWVKQAQLLLNHSS